MLSQNQKKQKVWRSFEEARAYVHSLELKGLLEWKAYCRSGQRPGDIPSNPNTVYQGQFLGYGDWVGTGTVCYRDRVFRPFEQARAYVRTLGLKNQHEWDAYSCSGQRPMDIPSNPGRIYPEFQGIADWIGAFNRWSKKSLLAFLEHLSQFIPLLTEKELYMIIQQEGLFPHLDDALGQHSPLQALQVLQQTASEAQTSFTVSPPDTCTDDHICSSEEIVDNPASPEATEAFLTSLSTSMSHEGKGGSGSASSHAIHAHSFTSKAFLHSIDQLSLPVELNMEVADYLVANRVNLLWEDYYNGGWPALEPILSGDGGPFFTAIKKRFLHEIHEIDKITLPEGWSFRDSAGHVALPNAMQRRTAWEVREKRRVGNWSGTGSGKTLAAILASRVIDAHITLIVTNCAALKGWCRHIRLAYPDSILITSEKHIPLIPADDQAHFYIVLNYEKFQQAKRDSLLHRLLQLRLDFVVFDEIQLIKQRQARASNRREALEWLLTQAKENNSNLYILGMSATPVINTLLEGKKLLELVVGKPFPEIESKHQTVNNALSLHRALMRHGFRTRPRYAQGIAIETIPIIHNDLYDRIRQAQGSVLHVEQALLLAKLDLIKDHICPGTILYTHYVQGMIRPIQSSLRSMGYTSGLYIGDEKSGLDDFLNGKVDVFIGSSPVGTGLDGLQTVCQRLIFLSLPWTGAAFEQIIGRIHRQGSAFENVEILIPQVLFSLDGTTWSWDQLRMSVIEAKRTLGDCVLDGQLPQTLSINKETLLRTSQKALDQWIERVKQHPEEIDKK